MKKILFSLITVTALAVSSCFAADSVGVNPQGFATPVYASWTATNFPSLQGTNSSQVDATNGYYPASILGGGGFASIVTNFVPLNFQGSPSPGNNLLISTIGTVAGTDVGGAASSSYTNFVFTLYTTQGPVTLTTNALGSVVPTNTAVCFFATITNGVGNTNIIYGTNAVFSPYTTPPFNANMRLWLGSVQCACTNTIYLTNWAIYAGQN